MSPLLWTSLGTAYVTLLWLLASAIATRRQILLGGIPFAAFALVIIVSASVGSIASTPSLALATVTCFGSIVCGVVDHRTGYIFDALTATSAFVAVALAFAGGMLPSSALAATLAGGTLGALYLITRGRGIGLGDVKLAAVVGLGYGPLGTALALVSAFVLGGCYGAALLATDRARHGDSIRFGPFIAGGTVIALFVVGAKSA
jgi:leader peptidase (prepilin peptidase) / N-methyltransferase